MVRGRDQVVGRTFLDDPPEIHDRDAVGNLVNQGEVVGDDEIGDAAFALNVAQKVDDLRLNGDVERGDGFVGNQHVGLERQRPRNGDTLPLAAGELRG